MKRNILLTLISLICILSNAQTGLDSLWTVWNDETHADTIRLEAMYTIAWDGYLFSQPDSAYYYGQVQRDFASKIGHTGYVASALSMQGLSLNLRGMHAEAIIHFRKAFEIAKQRGDLRTMAVVSGNMGNTFSDQGKHAIAIDQFITCFEMAEEAGDQKTMAGAMTNIAHIYLYIGDLPRTIEYLNTALETFEEIDHNGGIATTLMSLALVNKDQGNYAEALVKLDKASQIISEIDNDNLQSQLLYNYGVTYLKKEEFPKALEYFRSGVELCERSHFQRSLVGALLGMSRTHAGLKNPGEAIRWSRRVIEEAQTVGALDEQSSAYNILYTTYKAQGNGNLALASHEQMLLLMDSLKQEETAKKLQHMEFAKQLFADSLKMGEERLRVELAHKEEVHTENQKRNLAIGIGGVFLILAIAFYGRWRYVKRSKAIIETEKDKSDSLLLNILPAEIAQELKEKGQADARDFDRVSILFTDFKGFTATSEKLSAQDLVAEINICFEAFDGIMGKYHIEKIKTIGDAYMAAGGLPVPSDDSVKNTVLAALEMQAFISERKATNDTANKPAFEMRLGIHTGPVVAGIVGVKKFAYDIWGDTVNIASRMESSGEVGYVNISEATYKLLNDNAEFSFTSRGKIEVKGKGDMEMYFVERAL